MVSGYKIKIKGFSGNSCWVPARIEQQCIKCQAYNPWRLSETLWKP